MWSPQCTEILLLHNYISDVPEWFFLNIVSFLAITQGYFLILFNQMCLKKNELLTDMIILLLLVC